MEERTEGPRQPLLPIQQPRLPWLTSTKVRRLRRHKSTIIPRLIPTLTSGGGKNPIINPFSDIFPPFGSTYFLFPTHGADVNVLVGSYLITGCVLSRVSKLLIHMFPPTLIDKEKKIPGSPGPLLPPPPPLMSTFTSFRPLRAQNTRENKGSPRSAWMSSRFVFKA